MRRAAGVGLVVALAAAGHYASRSPSVFEEPLSSPSVWFAGCAEVRDGPVCAVSGGTLTLWVAGSAAPRIEIDGASASARFEAVAGGQRATVPVPAGASALRVAAGGGAWRLALAAAPEPIAPDVPPDALEARVRPAAGAERARLLRALGRAALRRGESDRAAAALAEARVEATAAGLDSEARLAVAIRAHVLLVQRRVADARAALAGLPAPPPGDAYGAYVTHHAGAQIARGAGDLRAAVAGLAAAADVAERVGLDAEARASRHEQGTLLGDLGRLDEAIAVLDGLRRSLPADAQPCERGDVLVNLGWAEVRAERAAAAVTHTRAGLRVYAGCTRRAAWRRSIARVNLAMAHLALDAPQDAAEALAGADAADGPEVAAWRLIVEGRLARRRGDLPAAQAAFAELERRARAADSTALRWRAGLELGLTAEAACDWPAAVDAYRAAEGLLFDESLHIAADTGRTRFLAHRAASATHLVRALVESGRADEAFDAARRARRRVLLGFSQHARLDGLSADRRARWEAAYADYVAARAAFEEAVAGDWDRSLAELATLGPAREAQRAKLSAALDDLATLAGRSVTAGALRPLSPDVPALGWFPAPAEPSGCAEAADARHYGFAAVGGRVRAAALTDTADPLGPFVDLLRPALETAPRVELLPAGPLRERDLHLLPLDGEPLSARLPVVWRLDGPPPPDAERAEAAGRRALVVIDPRVDLAGARREGRAVAGRLGSAGWSVQRLEGPAVTGEALRAALAGVELFHYAGHAVAEGLDGWQSAFLLAEDHLSVGELLTLSSAPRWAVLAACETGRTPGQVSGIGLAHALLSVGTRAVVATARPVEDGLAATFTEAFYGALLGPDGGSVYTAYRQGLAALPPAARGSFRLLVP